MDKCTVYLSEEGAIEADSVRAVACAHGHIEVHEQALLLLGVHGAGDAFDGHQSIARPVAHLVDHSIGPSSEGFHCLQILCINAEGLFPDGDGCLGIEVPRRSAKRSQSARERFTTKKRNDSQRARRSSLGGEVELRDSLLACRIKQRG
jgi:hypothetical protein